jgi:hypothetical protein
MPVKKHAMKITTKQRAARKRNIEIARRAKKGTAKGHMGRRGSKGFSAKAISRQIGKRGITRKAAVAELTKVVSADKAKRRRRIKDFYASDEGYAKKKRLRKKADAYAMGIRKRSKGQEFFKTKLRGRSAWVTIPK